MVGMMERKEIVGSDGFLYCSICGEPVEKEIDMPLLDGTGRKGKKKVHFMCRCRQEEKEAYERRLRFREEQRDIDILRQLSLMDARLKRASFDDYKVTDENKKIFDLAKRYVEDFDAIFYKGKDILQGILFWGGVGTGKSYTAAAIANGLLDRMQPVVMTSFIKLIEELSGFDSDTGSYMARLNQAKLLIIDDLGAERGTDFALEKVYDIVDSRYRSRKPIILTTNLDLPHIKSCDDIRYSRIYDRIFEMCYPVKMDGLSWRKKSAAAQFAETKKILTGC